MELENQEEREKVDCYPEKGQDLFNYVPSDITMNILSRLPEKFSTRCKCVSKPWLDLLTSPEFVKSHISNSVRNIAIFIMDYTCPKPCKVFQVVDELNPENHVRCWNMILNFNLPFDGAFEPPHSSVDGLLILRLKVMWRLEITICNPITREYIKLPCPQESFSTVGYSQLVETFGFGKSRVSGQYKLVRIFHEWMPPPESEILPSKFQVYTVGSGSWSRIASADPCKFYNSYLKGVFLNGNLHWLVDDFEDLSSRWISCFDLEIQLFSTFSLPHHNGKSCLYLCTLKDYLCFCDNMADDEIVIWSMKGYGDEKSWTKDFVINIGIDYMGTVQPIKVFKNGDILIALKDAYSNIVSGLVYFSSKTKIIHDADVFGLVFGLESYDTIFDAITYTPSFLPLKTFSGECTKVLNVIFLPLFAMVIPAFYLALISDFRL